MHTRSLVRHTLALTALTALACLAAPNAHAQFLGTSATGSLQFNGSGPNYFDPNNGFVPNGFSNKTQGTTVTVAEPAIEFGFADGVNTDTVNITNTTITLTDVIATRGSTAPFLVTLTDTAFAGVTFTQTANTTNSFTYSLTGNTLSLNFAGTNTGGTYTTTLTAASPVPEPGSVALLVGIVTVGAGFVRKRRSLR